VAVVGLLLSTAAACGSSSPSADSASGSSTLATDATTAPPTELSTTAPPTVPTTLPAIAPAVPGTPVVIRRVKGITDKVALTFDDGYCGECVGTMVGALERTGAHVTFCPNGTYGKVWLPYVDRIRALIAAGQLQICNHTWDHARITKLSAARLTDDINRNEQWIEATFGVSARPFFRPPYGSHDVATDRVAASLGSTSIILWSSTLSDSSRQPPQTILDQLQTNLVPGGIVLGHLNYPTTGQIFDQILAVLAQRGLTPVTVSELVAAGEA
jgi:peptidoglycan/xylan/chitin deacetylase (PgdA/CDA1 family)